MLEQKGKGKTNVRKKMDHRTNASNKTKGGKHTCFSSSRKW